MGYRLFEDKKISEVLNSVKQEIQIEKEKKILEKTRKPNFFRIEVLTDEKKIEKIYFLLLFNTLNSHRKFGVHFKPSWSKKIRTPNKGKARA